VVVRAAAGYPAIVAATTQARGRCLVMRMRTAGKTVLLVLPNASAGTGRTLDALNVTRWLAGQSQLKALPALA
jgi:serine-type D-Ala-D-Ala endopeptidase (penicillin-binding protein 7)